MFVATNYRFLPKVDMGTLIGDVAKSIRWVHEHIAEYGGDPERLFIMGHSAGAQLAALICIDDRYLKAEGLSLACIKGCVPVDGDTYDVPAMIETEETRSRVHGQPQAKYGYREEFGNDPVKHRDFSAVVHVAKDKGIPPFLIMYVAEHPDTTAQARRLESVLKAPASQCGFTVPDDPGTAKSTPISAFPTIPAQRRCSSSSARRSRSNCPIPIAKSSRTSLGAGYRRTP